MKTMIASLAFLVLAVSVNAQDKSDKFAIFVAGSTDTDAGPVAPSLIKKLKDSKPFVPVTQNDASKVVVLVSCMPRKQSDPFVCMYVSHFNGATFKTFLGGGLYFSASADEVANNFLGTIASDIVERFDQTNHDNLKQSLESCLFLTDSKCNVPIPLQKDVGAKQISLSQYLLTQSQ